MSGSESRPRKVELTYTHSNCESLHITTKLVITPTETSLTALIIIN